MRFKIIGRLDVLVKLNKRRVVKMHIFFQAPYIFAVTFYPPFAGDQLMFVMLTEEPEKV